jgi:hypothetical protein
MTLDWLVAVLASERVLHFLATYAFNAHLVTGLVSPSVPPSSLLSRDAGGCR